MVAQSPKTAQPHGFKQVVSTGSMAGLAVLTSRLGDDALILCQRLCQWITRAPTVEEDLALSNIALDLIGHARALLTLTGALDGTGRSEDDFAYGRTDREFANALLTELPADDFAVLTARQLAYSHYACLYYETLADGAHHELASLAARAAKEAAYHRRYADGWTLRLGLGTAYSARRMQAALDLVWPYTAEPFDEDEVVARLKAEGFAPSPASLHAVWQERTADVVHRAGLTVPTPRWHARGGRQGLHTEAFGALIAELQSVRKQYPGGVW
ncbi:1,2-phenylacetyl-CoA epoxidase subunit PaaC [Streptomyces sp. NPDC020800]|uniref:1,2-phenylacetyl-CoA epoxidase subunit PaaC n=1 Tax=Streptomyces sp. NPDC020800 TaxID=3365092 RepID=UPI0037B9A2B6